MQTFAEKNESKRNRSRRFTGGRRRHVVVVVVGGERETTFSICCWVYIREIV